MVASAPFMGGQATEREQLVKVSAVRKQIAEHMVRSVNTAPHAWQMREVDVSALVAYRAAQQAGFEARHGFRLSYVPILIQVVCAALSEHPMLNAAWTEDGIVFKHYVNMGIAVALPDALIVPVVKDADRKGLLDIARDVNDLAERARTKKLRPEDVQGGSFTFNNTGPLGAVAGKSIINQGQAAILSTEAIRRRPVVIDDQIVVRPVMYLSMSYDHRVVDFMEAGAFMAGIQARIERWTPGDIRL